MIDTEDRTAPLRAKLRELINTTVARGEIDGPEAIGAAMCVLSTYVAQVKNDTLRQYYIDEIVGTFAGAVAFARQIQEGTTKQ